MAFGCAGLTGVGYAGSVRARWFVSVGVHINAIIQSFKSIGLQWDGQCYLFQLSINFNIVAGGV